MDSLRYLYYAGNNQLQRVNDAVAPTAFTTDIDNQAITNNYVYDGVGNLVKDSSESLNVVWSPYGKVLSANRINATTNIRTQYGYDAMQNRVLKTFINVTDTTKTYYIRDAQGNAMAVYTRRKDTLVWTEQHLYGSSRLGTWEPNLRLTPSVDTSKKWQLREGQKKYELTNHLGNVLAVVSDRRQGMAPVSDQYAYYEATVITATDYYPFGLEMPGRGFQSGSYRYGFNGKENDRTSWSSAQLVQDYGMRLYNPAIGKFLSVDPLATKYAELTPYQFASNTPIVAIDMDGLEAIIKQKYLPEITKDIQTDRHVKAAINENRTVIMHVDMILGGERLIEDIPVYQGQSGSTLKVLLVEYTENIPLDRYNRSGTYHYSDFERKTWTSVEKLSERKISLLDVNKPEIGRLDIPQIPPVGSSTADSGTPPNTSTNGGGTKPKPKPKPKPVPTDIDILKNYNIAIDVTNGTFDENGILNSAALPRMVSDLRRRNLSNLSLNMGINTNNPNRDIPNAQRAAMSLIRALQSRGINVRMGTVTQTTRNGVKITGVETK